MIMEAANAICVAGAADAGSLVTGDDTLGLRQLACMVAVEIDMKALACLTIYILLAFYLHWMYRQSRMPGAQ